MSREFDLSYQGRGDRCRFALFLTKFFYPYSFRVILYFTYKGAKMADIQEAQLKFQISKEQRKINLANISGKASTAFGIASGLYVGFELGRVIIFATDTATQNIFNPADHVLPGLVAFGLSMGFGLAGMYLGNLKHRLSDEFNYQVKKEFANMGFELVDDEDADAPGRKSQQKWVRRDTSGGYRSTVDRPSQDRFWEGFWLASWMNSSSSRSSGGGRSSGGTSRSSSGNSNNGQGAAIAIAAIVLVAAAAACAFVSYKSFQLNFVKKAPPLLTGPDPDVFGLEEIADPQVAKVNVQPL